MERDEDLTEDEGKARDGQRGGNPRSGGTRLFGPEAEVECQSAECTCSTDAPEGVVDEHKVGLPVQPFNCSGTLRKKTARDLMGAQLGKRVRQRLG